MFYAMWLVCIMATQECKEITRQPQEHFKTEKECETNALVIVHRIHQYFLSQGMPVQVGYKCVLDKDNI